MIRPRLILFALVVGIAALFYFLTLCPTVEFIDSGELALAAENLGIAHPTGYPLYTLLGRLAAILIPGSLIFRVNLLSLLFTSFAAGFLYLLISDISSPAMHGSFRLMVAASSAIFVAFSPVWWSQGTTNEVYSLSLLLMAISLWFLFKAVNKSPKDSRALYFSSFTLGLSFCNHLSAIYLIPGYLILIIPMIKKFGRSRNLFLAFFFVLPLTLYFFLPIRAIFRPFLNWGGVSDPYFLYKHITGWQYRIWMFEKPLDILYNFSAKLGPAAKLYLEQFGWIGFVLCSLGLVICGIRYRKIFLLGITIGFVNLIYVLNYEIGDIESYYLPIFLVSTIFLGFGLEYLISLAMNRFRPKLVIRAFIVLMLLALPLSNLIRNYDISDRSHKTFARQGVLDIGGSMDNGGLAIVENWDFYSPWLYLHFSENFRPDLILLDKELMRRSWYIDFIRRVHKDIYARSQAEIEEFLRQVMPFERGRQFDPAVIDKAYYGMLQAIIIHERELRPVYTNILDDPKLTTGTIMLPDGILFRFGTPEKFLERPLFSFDKTYWQSRQKLLDKRVGLQLSFYARAFDSRQKYCLYFGKSDEGKYYGELSKQAKSIIDAIQIN